MDTNISTKLERYKELIEKVSNYIDKAEKKTAFENILNNMNSLIPDTINSNLRAIQCYTKFYFQDYVVSRYSSSRDCENIKDLIRFVNGNIKKIHEYENDSEEIRNERKLKLKQLSQTVEKREITVKRIITNGLLTHEEKKENPNFEYSYHGTYKEYLSFKSHRYFSICLNIKRYGYTDFETVNYLVLLYIALNNELSILNDEIGLLIPSQQLTQPETNIDKVNTRPQRTINTEKLKPYFKSGFKGMGNTNANYFEWLVSHLQTDRTPKAFAYIALMIYESQTALNSTKPGTFKNWYSIFCECVGCIQRTYKKNQLKNPPEQITKTFNYL